MAPATATTPGHYGSWPYGWAVSTSGPSLEKRRSRRRQPGHRSLGTAAHQGEALGVEVAFFREAGAFCRKTVYLCDPTGPGPRRERRIRQPRTGGVDSTRRGKAPPLAILSPISHRGEMGPSGASPAGALVCAKDKGAGELTQNPVPDFCYDTKSCVT